MSANGRLSTSELRVVEDNDRLSLATANAFFRARDAWYATGGSGACIVEPAGAYRDYDTQYAMKHGIPSYAYWNLNPKSKAGLASAGSSTHGTGTRFDATPGFNVFLLRRGKEFGFTREFGANDPNHWKHNGVTASTGYEATPITRPRVHHGRRKDMLPLVIHDGKGLLGKKNAVRTYLFGPGLWHETTGEPTADLVSLILIGTDRSGNYFDTPNLTYAELYAYARDSGACPPAQLAKFKVAAGL